MPNQPAGGKTGTAHDYGNAWFVGATPQLATTVWVGSLGNVIPMRTVAGTGRVTGGSLPARIWGQYMSTVLAGAARVDWPAASPSRSRGSVVAPTEVGVDGSQTPDGDDD